MQYHQNATEVSFITIRIVQPEPNSIRMRILLKITNFLRVWGVILLSKICKYCIYILKFEVNCAYTIYLLRIMEVTIKMDRLVVFCVA